MFKDFKIKVSNIVFHIKVSKLLCCILRFQNFCVRVSKTKNQCSFSKCFFRLGFLNLGFNHNKNNASFRVRVEWGIRGLMSKWRRLMI